MQYTRCKACNAQVQYGHLREHYETHHPNYRFNTRIVDYGWPDGNRTEVRCNTCQKFISSGFNGLPAHYQEAHGMGVDQSKVGAKGVPLDTADAHACAKEQVWKCKDCGCEFTYAVGKGGSYSSASDHKHCPECSGIAKQKQAHVVTVTFEISQIGADSARMRTILDKPVTCDLKSLWDTSAVRNTLKVTKESK